jgi:hypothetical protein
MSTKFMATICEVSVEFKEHTGNVQIKGVVLMVTLISRRLSPEIAMARVSIVEKPNIIFREA